MKTDTNSVMNIDEFKRQLRELQVKKFHGLTNQQVFSYIRIYYAVYLMVSVYALDSEYGDRKLYVRKLERLLRIILRRYEKTTSLTEKIQMLYMTFFINENMAVTFDRNKYWEMGAALIEEFIGKATDNEADLYIALRMIFVQWYGLVEDDGSDTPCSLTFARKKISSWAESLSDDGSWQGISDIEALHRIIVFALNSSMMLDETHNEKLNRAYEHYCISDIRGISSTSRLTEAEVNKYTVMYYALQMAPISMARYTDERPLLAQLLARQLPHLTRNAEYRTRCRCIALDNMCMQVTEQVQKIVEGKGEQ